MARINFDNAIIDVNGSLKPMESADFLFRYGALYNSSGTQIGGNSIAISSDTPTKKRFTFSGSFTANGTEFYLGQTNNLIWKVSNISFSSGDTYGFVIDVEIG